MHREVPHNKFPASFGHFVEAIFDFFRRRLPQEWTKWRDTVTDKFRKAYPLVSGASIC